jgi:hypothetical protein
MVFENRVLTRLFGPKMLAVNLFVHERKSNPFRYHSLSATPGLHAFIMAEVLSLQREMSNSRATLVFGAGRQVRSYVQVPAFTSRLASRRRHNLKWLSRLYTPNDCRLHQTVASASLLQERVLGPSV